jgi:predicted DsbA family dithiol-disulfide isomerase
VELVRFSFDPRCPWCWQTSRWARRLQELGEIRLEWVPFSLEVVNLPEGEDPRAIDAHSGPPLRTALVLADEQGHEAVGRFYAALGARQFDQVPPVEDGRTWATEALAAAGLDEGACARALADPGTWDTVVDLTLDMVARIGKLGVPTLTLDGPGGTSLFGPVISEVPDDDEAVELWRHTAWLVRNRNFAELKRSRVATPDLALMRWHREQRAKEKAAKAAQAS